MLPAAAEAKVEGAIVFDGVDSSRNGSGGEQIGYECVCGR